MNYVALLRGINVGGRIIKMSDLQANFESLGLEHVSTVLQTGNVLFGSGGSPDVLVNVIETSLMKAFDYSAKVQVVSMKFLKGAVEAYPFDVSVDTHQNYVIFFEDGLERVLAAEARSLDASIEQIALGDGVLYWHVPKGLTLKSPFAKYLTMAKYKSFHSNRNINTLQKILAA